MVWLHIFFLVALLSTVGWLGWLGWMYDRD